MSWYYDLFSFGYDVFLERSYREQRALSAEALQLRDGLTVLDLPVGTGQSLDTIARGVGQTGRVVGVDLSAGMLSQARKRSERLGYSDSVHLVQCSALELASTTIEGAIARPTVDRLHIFLGLTAFPEWERAFALAWDRLAAGGRCVVVDVYAAQPGLQGMMVNWVARADIRRRFWEPLEAVGENFRLTDLPSERVHGGQLKLATATKT